MSVENQRITYIDVLKGIGIICIVIGHIIPYESFFHIWIYSFHVPIFFILSGILLNNKQEEIINKDLKKNIIKRFKSLIYPYITFSVIVIMKSFLKYIMMGNVAEFIENILKTITLYGYGTLWFLPVLFFSEILFIKFIKQKQIMKIITFLVICVEIILFYIFDFENYILFFINRICIAFLFIGVGYFITKIEVIINKKILLVMSYLMMIIIIPFVMINGNCDLHLNKFNNIVLYFLNAILNSLSLIYIFKYTINKSRILEFCGKNSLIIMTTHSIFPIINICNKVISDINFLKQNIILNYFVNIVMVMLLEMLVVIIINKYFKFLCKVPNIKEKKYA